MSGTIPERLCLLLEQVTGIFTSLEVGSPLRVTFMFRGQADATWGLEPSFTRLARTYNLSAEQALEVEAHALRVFEMEAPLHTPIWKDIPREKLTARWALMQHYGAPTRLLDWTRSPYVAAFFAAERELDKPGAVWVAHVQLVRDFLRGKFGDRDGDSNLPVDQLTSFTRTAPNPMLYVGEDIYTDRMAAQATIFTVSPWVLQDHQEVLAEAVQAFPKNIVVLKLVIPPEVKASLLRGLRQMNVTARSLFPGLDGFSRSVAELLRLGIEHETGKAPFRHYGL